MSSLNVLKKYQVEYAGIGLKSYDELYFKLFDFLKDNNIVIYDIEGEYFNFAELNKKDLKDLISNLDELITSKDDILYERKSEVKNLLNDMINLSDPEKDFIKLEYI